jgi:hypothetical protein
MVFFDQFKNVRFFQTRALMTIQGLNTGGQGDPGDMNKLTIEFQAILCNLPEVTPGTDLF